MIGDIIIHNDVIHTTPHLGAALWEFVVKPKPIDYRRLELRTNLLQFAIKKARQRGIKRICGSLTQEDINNNFNLIRWCKKYGLEILPPSPENIENAVFGISRDLKEKLN